MSLNAPVNIQVLSQLTDVNRIKIIWDHSVGATSYKVYRCAVPYGTSTLIQSGITFNYFSDLPVLNLNLDWFYSVQSINVTESSSLSFPYSIEDFEFTPVNFPQSESWGKVNDEYYSSEDDSFMFKEMRVRLENILNYGGEYVWLYKRKWADSEVDESGRKGTYWDPIQIRVKFENTDFIRVSYLDGVRSEFKPRTWTIYYPKLRDRDILVNRQNERFELMNVTHRRVRGWLYKQEFDTVLLERVGSDVQKLIPTTPLPTNDSI